MDERSLEESIRIQRGEPNSSLCEWFRDKLNEHVASIPESATLPGPMPGSNARPMKLADNSLFLYAETGPLDAPVPVGSICVIQLHRNSSNFTGLPPELDKVGEIKRTIVLESHRRKGIAQSLIETAEQHARDVLGLQYMVIETWNELVGSQATYEKAGYTERSVFGDYHVEGFRFYEKWL